MIQRPLPRDVIKRISRRPSAVRRNGRAPTCAAGLIAAKESSVRGKRRLVQRLQYAVMLYLHYCKACVTIFTFGARAFESACITSKLGTLRSAHLAILAVGK